jgi:hypothetical protein
VRSGMYFTISYGPCPFGGHPGGRPGRRPSPPLFAFHKPASLYEAFSAAEAAPEPFEWYTPKHGFDRRIPDKQTLIGAVLYHLFIICANPKPAARNLAMKLARHTV